MATVAAARDQEIREEFARGQLLEGAKVDRTQNIIRDVKLLGKNSRNNRVYAEQAMNDAARLYEGVPFYIDHPTEREMKERKGVRSVMDLAGRVMNPRRVGDSVRGDLHLLDREPIKSMVFALAEQMPTMAGNSHRARGAIRPGANGAGDIVESLAEVFAVELVTDPATTAGLFESVQEDEMDFKKLTIADLKKERPDLVESLVTEAKGDGELEQLKAKNKELLEAAAKTARATLITKKLEDAKLPKDLVTDAFRTQLTEAKDEAAIDVLLADRKELAKGFKAPPAGGGRPQSTERTVKEGSESKTEPIDESKASDYARTLGVKLVTS